MGGVDHLGGIFIQRGGYTTSVEYSSRGGSRVHHLSGIFFPASHFPQCSIFPPLFFSLGGAVALCCMVSHSSQLSIVMMVFFLVGGCVGGGGGECQTFPCPFMRGRKEGKGRVRHFYRTFAEMCSILCP